MADPARAIDPGVRHYDLRRVLSVINEHRRELVAANVIAILAVLAAVPLPLMMPLLVDEVLLEQPAFLVETMNGLFPASWHGPGLYVTAILALTVVLRFGAVLLGVWQTRQFSHRQGRGVPHTPRPAAAPAAYLDG